MEKRKKRIEAIMIYKRMKESWREKERSTEEKKRKILKEEVVGWRGGKKG